MPSHRITTLTHKLKALTDDAAPNNRATYNAAVSARYPAHQVNGIWHYDEDDLPAIMAAFGLRSGCGPRPARRPARTASRSSTPPSQAHQRDAATRCADGAWIDGMFFG